jgi:arylsulfatase A-like enzyme/glycerophosphoryl diester phosphodiesterase
MTRCLRNIVLVLLAILFADTCSVRGDPSATPPPRPNILWFIAEDMSPDLGCYGAKLVSTPNLDRLAASGVRYTRAFTTAPVCSPSRSAFCTGMYQTTIGAHNHRAHRDDGYRLPPGVKVVTDWMRESGYFTANLITLPKELGFKGVGKTDWNFQYEGQPFDSTRWEDLKSHQPFYAQINFHETHRPYRSPKSIDPARVDLPPIYPDHPIAHDDWARYLDSANELDRKIGLLLKQLEADGLADDTIVLFMADHGESHVRGKQFCYDDGLRIPLIIRWAKNFPAPRQFKPGTVDSQLIAAIDLVPTFLDVVGHAKPAKMEGRIFLGEHAEPAREYVFAARDRCDETVFRFRTVRDTRYRYIRNFTPERPFLQSNRYKESAYPVWKLISQLGAEGKLTDWQKSFYLAERMPAEELYNMDADPWSMTNLAASEKAEHQTACKRLRHALDKWLTDTNDQGRALEPVELARNEGRTKPTTNMLASYRMEESPPLPWVVGHRGLARHAPENTLRNMHACLELHVGIELDVRRARDAALVVLHDPTLNRTTTGRGKVGDFTVAQLKKLDAGSWFDSAFQDERIPTLEEVFALRAKFPASAGLIAVDLKEPDTEEDVLRLAAKHGVVDRLVFIGLAITMPEVRQRLHKAAPRAASAVLATPETFDKVLADPDASWIYLRHVPDRAEVTRIHAAGKRVFLSGPQVAALETDAWKQAASAGVDAILTDYPLELTRMLRPQAAGAKP